MIFEAKERRNNCNEIQIDGNILVLLHAYAKRKSLEHVEHSLSFFLEKFYGYVCLRRSNIESMKNCIITIFLFHRGTNSFEIFLLSRYPFFLSCENSRQNAVLCISKWHDVNTCCFDTLIYDRYMVVYFPGKEDPCEVKR